MRQSKSVSDISADGPAVPTRKLEEIEIEKLYKDFNKKKLVQPPCKNYLIRIIFRKTNVKLQLFPSMKKSAKTKGDETMFNHLYVHTKGKTK